VVQRPSSSTNQPNSNAGRRSATRPRGAGSRPFPPSRVPLAQRRLGNRHRMLHLNNLDRPGHHSIEQSEPGPSLTPTWNLISIVRWAQETRFYLFTNCLYPNSRWSKLRYALPVLSRTSISFFSMSPTVTHLPFHCWTCKSNLPCRDASYFLLGIHCHVLYYLFLVVSMRMVLDCIAYIRGSWC